MDVEDAVPEVGRTGFLILKKDVISKVNRLERLEEAWRLVLGTSMHLDENVEKWF